MDIYLAFTMTHVFLEQVGNVRLVTLVNHQIKTITEPVLKAALHGILMIFGQANNQKLEKQIAEIFEIQADIREIKDTLSKVVDQVNIQP